MKKPSNKDQLSLSFERSVGLPTPRSNTARVLSFADHRGARTVSVESEALRRVLIHAESLKRRP